MHYVGYDKVKECESFFTWLLRNNEAMFRIFGFTFTKYKGIRE